MQLNHLYLRNFRNFAEAEVTFHPKINTIFGENAQGKSNLLEAILLLSTGRSFRTQHLAELIREKEAGFYLEAELTREGVSHWIKLSFDGQNKRLQINSSAYSHFTPLLGLLPSVLYAPKDSELISGSPSARRRFLDLHLAQTDPLYVHHLTRFHRAMKQRNFLLRSKRMDAIECWENEMARSGCYIQEARKNLSDSLLPLLQETSQKLSGERETHTLAFHPSYGSSFDSYLELLIKNRRRDQELKLTSAGPHRDDLSFSVDGRLARLYSSEGQRKTVIAALKLAEWKRIAERLDAPPIFAVDDLGLPLDSHREKALSLELGSLGQVFVTVPSIKDSSHAIEIHAGSVILSK